VQYNQYDTAMELLKNFTENYPESIHIDDALLLYAKLFYEHKKDKENAMKTLEILFEKYPGSVLIHSARNMYRKIRGDYNKQT
jgi:TolA-binding protein